MIPIEIDVPSSAPPESVLFDFDVPAGCTRSWIAVKKRKGSRDCRRGQPWTSTIYIKHASNITKKKNLPFRDVFGYFHSFYKNTAVFSNITVLYI
jgi:hypothetical protein